MTLVPLRTYYDPLEAQIVLGRLQAEGVEAVIFDSGISASYGGAYPVRLMVLKEDHETALSILEGTG